MDWLQPTLTWYLASTAIAFAVAPLILMTFRHVTDHGASLIRPLGLLLLVWPVWLLASVAGELVPIRGLTLWLAVAAAAGVLWLVGLRARILNRDSLMHLAIAEGGHLVVFAGALAWRGFVPAVAGPNSIDQEKPMDLMMLASSMRATSMPPADAWLSGHDINYYYLGYTLWGSLGEMIGTTPDVAYNLAMISTFAMTVVAVVGTIANILSRFVPMNTARAGGALGVVLILLIGNPWAAWQWLRDPVYQWEAFPFQGIMWRATRIIPIGGDFAISEFPAFSFIFADLHPHLIAIPFAITALGLAWMFASLPPDTALPGRLARLALAGVSVTALYTMNSWDFPTWFAIVALGVLVSPGFPSIAQRLAGIATMLAAGVVAWLPFLLSFDAPVRSADNGFTDAIADVPAVGTVVSSIGAYTGERTSILDYLSIFGFFYPVLVATILVALRPPAQGTGDPLVNRLAVVTGILFAAIGLLLPAPLLIVVGLPMIAGLVVVLRATNVTLELVAVGLATIAFGLTLIPEFFYLLDAFGTRMNTIFKLYLQVWLISGVATTLGLVYLWQRVRSLLAGRMLVALAAATIVLAGLTYPVVAASQWLPFKNPDRNWEGVAGLAWLEEPGSADPATLDALRWLWENGTNDDVLLAAGGCSYRAPIGMPAAASGVPAIIGDDTHQRQWHLGTDWINPEIERRVADVNALFEQPTDELLDEYGVTLIYVGRPEINGLDGVEPSASCAPGPFDNASSPDFPGDGWTEVFSEDGIRILRRNTGE